MQNMRPIEFSYCKWFLFKCIKDLKNHILIEVFDIFKVMYARLSKFIINN